MKDALKTKLLWKLLKMCLSLNRFISTAYMIHICAFYNIKTKSY